jgi:hypothetical protein
MAFHDHRPNQRLGRSERPLIKLTSDLTSSLHKAQRSLTYDTLHLSSRQCSLLAHILVEFAEDLHQDIGIWRSLEQYNLDFFGTPLPCVLPLGETMDPELVNLDRVRFLLWNLYGELEPDLILAPNHQDLERLSLMIIEFFSERFPRLHFDSGVKRFLTTPHQYGWEVKRKLVWLGQDSYLFRLHCASYIREHGGKADIPTLDDFLCQETTSWSGLGVIDILASTLDMTESQRRDLRSWYERHTGYFRVASIHEPFMEVVNVLNEQSYTVRVDENANVLEPYQMMFGALVPWDGGWYWSGTQQGIETVTEDIVELIKQEFPVKASQIVYRYCEERAAKARELIGKHYQHFIDYFGKDLVIYPDGKTMAEDERKFRQHQFDSAPKEEVEAFLQRHHLSEPAPKFDWDPELLECEDGIGVYFNPDEGQEIMTSFNDVLSGFQKRGSDLNADESEMIRQFIYSDSISPKFVEKLVQAYGDASIASSFLIPQDDVNIYLAYLLRRYKGHFYRNRYPSLSIVD